LGAILCCCAAFLGFLYKGLQTAPAGGSSIVAQMLIPIATVLSVIFLKEKIGLIRATAIAAAFLGVCFMVYKPGALSFDWGLIYILLAYVSLAISRDMPRYSFRFLPMDNIFVSSRNMMFRSSCL